MMSSAQVVEMLVNAITNSPSQDYTHLDDHNLPTNNLLIRMLHLCINVSYLVSFCFEVMPRYLSSYETEAKMPTNLGSMETV